MPAEPTPPRRDYRPLSVGARYSILGRLGQRLRIARLEAKLTQAQAADTVGSTAQTIRNWETARNEPPPWAITKLAERYNVTEDSLLDDLTSPMGPPRSGLSFQHGRIPVDGHRLSQARRDAGYTQTGVVDMTGINISAIRRYERGISHPSARALQTLATIYNKPAGWFTTLGYFTEDEQARFDAATTLTMRPGNETDPVLATYNVARPDLSDDAKQRIANFIVLTRQQAMSSPNPYIRTSANRSPSPPPDGSSPNNL